MAYLEPGALRPLSRAEYDQLVASGVFEDERVELLYGMVVRMPPIGPLHDGHVQRAMSALFRAVDPRAIVRVQASFAASAGSEPQPDVAVVPPGDYDQAHPERAFLIVEVASTSLSRDRGPKATLCAESGVPEYWIVNLVDGVIEVHTDPASGAYTRVTPYRRGDTIQLNELADVTIAVSDILR